MTLEEIRKNAPYGATHYGPLRFEYYRVDAMLLYKWVNKEWSVLIEYPSYNLKPLY